MVDVNIFFQTAQNIVESDFLVTMNKFTVKISGSIFKKANIQILFNADIY